MLVSQIMTGEPTTIEPDQTVKDARAKMAAGGFRRLPVVEDGRLVGIITDRDVRERPGFEAQVRVATAMSEPVVTIAPDVRVEIAGQMMLDQRVGGFPVVEDGELTGVITTTDLLKALCAMLGTQERDTCRIDLLPSEGMGGTITPATKAITDAGGEVIAVGTYLEKEQGSRVFYITLRGGDLEQIRRTLSEKRYEVLGVHA